MTVTTKNIIALEKSKCADDFNLTLDLLEFSDLTDNMLTPFGLATQINHLAGKGFADKAVATLGFNVARMRIEGEACTQSTVKAIKDALPYIEDEALAAQLSEMTEAYLQANITSTPLRGCIGYLRTCATIAFANETLDERLGPDVNRDRAFFKLDSKWWAKTKRWSFNAICVKPTVTQNGFPIPARF